MKHARNQPSLALVITNDTHSANCDDSETPHIPNTTLHPHPASLFSLFSSPRAPLFLYDSLASMPIDEEDRSRLSMMETLMASSSSSLARWTRHFVKKPGLCFEHHSPRGIDALREVPQGHTILGPWVARLLWRRWEVPRAT